MNKTVFYILSFTWGLPLTLAGVIIAGFLLLTGHKPERFGYGFYFRIGRTNWGGQELGPFFLRDKSPDPHLCYHEAGHGIQNCIFGPFMIPFICLPSFLRYWARRIARRMGHKLKHGYDDIWFEGWATRLGHKYFDSRY